MKQDKTMNCSLSSCRFNADGECCNAEAYQQCINACEAVLGEEYQRFKEWERVQNERSEGQTRDNRKN